MLIARKKEEEKKKKKKKKKKHVHDPKHISRNASCSAAKYTHAKRLRNFKKEQE